MKVPDSQSGYSVIELLVVLICIAIFVAMAISSFSTVNKYDPDDQAMIIVDMLNQARQFALNERRTFRVEINRTKKKLTLINEMDPSVATDDIVEKSIAMKGSVIVGEVPSNVLSAPVTTSPIPVLSFQSSNYPLSSGDEKITLRFAKNGRVLDTGTDNIGTGSTMRGATIYIFMNEAKTTTPQIIRAVTLLQTSGDTSILKCSFDVNRKCGNWKK